MKEINCIMEYRGRYITEYVDGTTSVSLIPHPDIEAAKRAIDKVVDIIKIKL